MPQATLSKASDNLGKRVCNLHDVQKAYFPNMEINEQDQHQIRKWAKGENTIHRKGKFRWLLAL